MTLSEFVRIYPLRSKGISWLFGAGSSVAAGMPSASDLVWEFKKRIYCSEEGVHLSVFNNLSDQALRKQIQNYFESKVGYPQNNSIEEYSFYFESAFGSPADRRAFLDQQLSSIQNSYGHKVIGVLMKNKLLPLIFTTNFDKAFENAAVEQLKRLDSFFVGDLDNNETAIRKYNEGFRPIIIKMHGDYFSDALKNTSDELRSQDLKLRQVFSNSCMTNGLAVMGYSGRDQSIMQVMNDAIIRPGAFSAGIFWFVREGSGVIPEVTTFLEAARDRGIQSELIEIDNFDTAWAEVVKGFPDLPRNDVAGLNINYFRMARAKVPDVGKSYPVIRLNAVIIDEIPTNARLLKCDIGNTSAVKSAIHAMGHDILAIRRKSGVVGFGADSDFSSTFAGFGSLQFEVFTITDKMLIDDDSAIKGLVTEALAKALCRAKNLRYTKRHSTYYIYPDTKQIGDPTFVKLTKELVRLTGKIPGSQSSWVVAMEISIQVKFSKALLIFKPTVITSKSPNPSDRFVNAAYVNEATARWYNKKILILIELWLDIIFKGNKQVYLTTYNDEIRGFNGKFKLIRDAVYAKSN